MITDRFLQEFQRTTEEKWGHRALDRSVYGYQFQPGTRWNPGLDETRILEYEASLEVRFPDDFKMLLRNMNGTDLPTLNVYGHSGEPFQHSVGVYAYPRDLQLVKRLINRITQKRDQLRITMEEQGFTIPDQYDLVPIYMHRYVLCTGREEQSTVLSIHDSTDAIVYGATLAEYLKREFLQG